MAKAKKQESNEQVPAGEAAGATKKRAAAKPKAPAKAAAGKPGPAGSGGVPLIDTSLAAAAAASMIRSRAGAGASGPEAGADESGDKRETSTFKQLKQSLSKGGSTGLGGILGGVQGGKKNSPTFNGPNQVRRNQTFGADASRTNLPRRTGG